MGFSLEDLKNNRNKGLVTSSSKTGSLVSVKKPRISINSASDIDSKLDVLAKKTIVSSTQEFARNTGEIVFIIDKSGSVEGTESTVIEGFKNFIDKERKLKYPTKISTILFSNGARVVHDNTDIEDVKSFSYLAIGGTALYDTFLRELTRIENRQKMTCDIPKDTIVITMTDGLDNESDSSLEEARTLIERLQKKGWHFIFLGAKQNAKEIAEALSIDPLLAEEYDVTADGLLANFEGAHNAVKSIRLYGKVDPGWAKPIVDNRKLLTDGKSDDGGKRLMLGGKK